MGDGIWPGALPRLSPASLRRPALLLAGGLGLAGLLDVLVGRTPERALAPAPTAEAITEAQTDQLVLSEYTVTWHPRPACAPPGLAGPVLQAPNRAHGLRLCFTAAGIQVVPRTGEPGWHLGLVLSEHGAAGALVGAAEAAPVALGNRVEYPRGPVTEWYVNDPRGLEQGFTLHGPLTGADETVLRVAVSGDLSAAPDGDGVVFRNDDGRRVIDFGHLRAWDANGAVLPARLVVESRAIEIHVRTAGASYPVTVDPLVTASPWTAESNQADALFGWSVSSAGDVNGDGYSDLIVGAPFFDNGENDEGRAYVFMGGPDGLATTPAWVVESNQAGARFGYSVATAGDVNGDGYADVIVGAPRYSNGQVGEGRAFVFHGGPGGLATTAAWFVEVDQSGASLGWAVAGAGDVNGDGYADVIVGAPDYQFQLPREGLALVYHGSAGGLSTSPAWSERGRQSFANYGHAVASAWDVNGDGYADVIVGAPGYSNGQAREGRVWVYQGSATGLVTAGAWTGESNQAQAEYGWSVAGLGDFDGDGYGDVAVGAPGYDFEGSPDEGAVFIYTGDPNGLAASSEMWRYLHVQIAGFGFAVAGVGDTDGDGLGDLLVGTPYGLLNRGFALVRNAEFQQFQIVQSFAPSQDEARFGWAVGAAGDVNGDGIADVAVGAPYWDAGEADEGRVFVYLGRGGGPPTGFGNSGGETEFFFSVESDAGAAVAGAGDVNGDGYADVLIGARSTDEGSGPFGGRIHLFLGGPGGAGPPGWSVGFDQPGAVFGYSVAGAGDTNGDGFADFLVGAPEASFGQNREGIAYFYFGGPDGPGDEEWVGQGDQVAALYGLVVAGAGDVNGDGYADLLVSAPLYDNGQNDEGRVYVYHGGPGGPSPVPAWIAESNQAGAQFGWSAAAAGDVNGDGFGDVIIGAPYYTNGQNGEGRAYVYLGGPGGLALIPVWVEEPDQVDGGMGAGVAAAGDVNGDGYDDVLVRKANGETLLYLGGPGGPEQGAIWSWSSSGFSSPDGVPIHAMAGAGDTNGDGYGDVLLGFPEANILGVFDAGGRVRLLSGGPAGLGAPLLMDQEPTYPPPNQPRGAWFGYAVAAAGDVNGDGAADVIIGAPGRGGPSDVNRAVVSIFYGQGGLRGPRFLPAQRTTAGPVGMPIQPRGLTRSLDSVRLSLRAHSPFAGGRARLEVEVKPSGVPFDGSGTLLSPGWVSVVPGGTDFAMDVTGLAPGTHYRWRARLRFQPASTPLLPASRWFMAAGDGPGPASFRTERDTDGDGVFDSLDNCISVANANQRDTNFDGYGNACDADLNDDGIVNFTDLAIFRSAFGTANAHADFNGDGVVNFIDLAIFRNRFGQPPGPSAQVY